MAEEDTGTNPPARPIQLPYWKRQRHITRLNANREIKKLQNQLELANVSNTDEISISCQKLRDYTQRLRQLDENTLPFLGENDLEAAVEDSDNLEQEMQDLIFRTETELNNRNKAENAEIQAGATNLKHDQRAPSCGRATVKLPKLDIHHFDGDTLKWREFWDSFEAAVHNKPHIPSIEKFQYLKSYLEGCALEMVEGYALSTDTYDIAVAALKERYDHPERCVNAHLDAMIYMEESGKSVDELQRTLDRCETHIRSLGALGMTEETFGKVLAPLMLSKFPQFIRIELNRRNSGEAWTLVNLRKYLKEEINARHMGSQTVGGRQDTVVVHKSAPNTTSQRNRYDGKLRTASSLVTTSYDNKRTTKGKPYPCAFCNGTDHFNENCTKFKTSEARWSALSKNRCVVCLRPNHRKAECRSGRPCKYCGLERSHHSSLCNKKYGSLVKPGNANGLNIHAKEFARTGASVCGSPNNKHPPVNRGRSILATAMAWVKGKRKSERVRIVMDSCSTRSFARKDVLTRIGARHIGNEPLGLAGLEADERHYDEFGCYEIAVVCNDGEEIPIAVNSLKTITCSMDKEAIRISDYPILSKFELADSTEEYEPNVQLDILIGLDHYYRFIGNMEVRLSETLVLLNTKLGYIPNGSVSCDSLSTRQQKNATTLLVIGEQLSSKKMDSDLERLWRLEDVGMKEFKINTDDELAAANFKRNIRYDDESKRYAVRWPWKSDHPELQDNYYLALGRLKSLVKRLDSKTLDAYDNIIRDQLSKNVIEAVPEQPTGPTVHYIPHHCVVRPDKSTTKVRIVYDASAKSKMTEKSLNEGMYRGPVLLEDLCGLIMRFGLQPIGIVSDIEKAFLQVALQEVDRDVTRFFWLKDHSLPATEDNIVKYRFTRVLFGAIASPYILAATIEHHLSALQTPVAAKILKSCYVDNVITGANSLDEAIQYYREAKSVFSSASMNLREWFSNDKDLMNAIPPEDRGMVTQTSVLGLKWNILTDTLSCQSKLKPTIACKTKRRMLQAIAQLFDPCGFLSPVTIVGKILIQQLWKLNIEWDKPVSQEIQEKWNIFQHQLVLCPSVIWHRTAKHPPNATFQLHCFCDASKNAYGAVVYLKSESTDDDKDDICQLVFAKARVSPAKEQTLTIPRLELTALNMGCKLLVYVQRNLGLHNCRLIAWTDSQCCIHWVNGKARSPVYVKNRVDQILRMGEIEMRYVPTADNPADLPSRGTSVDSLIKSTLWWKGPPWLSKTNTEWPEAILEFSIPEKNVEESIALQVSVVQTSPIDPSLFSNFVRLLRVTAWMMRFIDGARGNRREGILQVSEIKAAKKVLIRVTQNIFASESSKEFLEIKSQLGMFLDPGGLLRCSGKLDNADLPYDVCFPIFIPRQAFITKLIIKDRHEGLAHAGSQHVISSLRCEYWIPRIRSQVRAAISACRICRRVKGGHFRSPKPPPLPAFRAVEKPSFATVGIDYLGPLIVRTELNGMQKVWICLFTCCTSRAVHLEVISDMSACQFLLCLRRFVALYGAPELIISDNAKQFGSTARVVDSIWHQTMNDPGVQAFSIKKGTKWKFIVEFAPWMGGFYERMVGIVKKALRCSIHNQLLSIPELHTVCSEICTIVNSRPLTYYNGEFDTMPLTPSDLIVRNKNLFPVLSDDDTQDNDYLQDSRSRLMLTWKRLDNRCKGFWKAWHRDYMTALRERNWFPSNRGGSHLMPKLDTVVLIHEENIPRSQWKIGRIVSLIQSSDSIVRAAKIKTSNGRLLQRPLKLLYPLEVPEGSVEHEDARNQTAVKTIHRPQRAAAAKSRLRWKKALNLTDEEE